VRPLSSPSAFDINLPQNPIPSGYIWLPLELEGDHPIIRWRNEWDLSVFSSK
jgi:hypothetical protein